MDSSFATAVAAALTRDTHGSSLREAAELEHQRERQRLKQILQLAKFPAATSSSSTAPRTSNGSLPASPRPSSLHLVHGESPAFGVPDGSSEPLLSPVLEVLPPEWSYSDRTLLGSSTSSCTSESACFGSSLSSTVASMSSRCKTPIASPASLMIGDCDALGQAVPIDASRSSVADLIQQEISSLEKRLSLKIMQSHTGLMAKLGSATAASEAVLTELRHKVASCAATCERSVQDVCRLDANLQNACEDLQSLAERGKSRNDSQSKLFVDFDARMRQFEVTSSQSGASSSQDSDKQTANASFMLDANLLLSLDQTIGALAASLDSITDRVQSQELCLAELGESVSQLTECSAAGLLSNEPFRPPKDETSLTAIEAQGAKPSLLKERRYVDGIFQLGDKVVEAALVGDASKHLSRPCSEIGLMLNVVGSPNHAVGTSSEEPDEEDSLRAVDSPWLRAEKLQIANSSSGHSAMTEGTSSAVLPPRRLLLGEFT